MIWTGIQRQNANNIKNVTKILKPENDKLFGFYFIYMESIRAVQAQSIYKVNPVNLFERREQKEQSNIFAQNFNFNLDHPQAKSPTLANSLDLLA